MEANQADLSHSFFRWHPWIFAMTVPVIGIRSWSEESQCGVFEVMGTQPIRTIHWAIAKAFCGFVIILCALLFTFPAVITTVWLGNPDLGTIACGYIGSLLCGWTFVVVSQAVCSAMKVSIGSFVCSVAICLILVICGITHVANIILNTFPDLEWMTKLLSGISVVAKYEAFAQGRIELSAITGFLALILAAILVSHRALLSQRAPAGYTTKWPTIFRRGKDI